MTAITCDFDVICLNVFFDGGKCLRNISAKHSLKAFDVESLLSTYSINSPMAFFSFLKTTWSLIQDFLQQHNYGATLETR